MIITHGETQGMAAWRVWPNARLTVRRLGLMASDHAPTKFRGMIRPHLQFLLLVFAEQFLIVTGQFLYE